MLKVNFKDKKVRITIIILIILIIVLLVFGLSSIVSKLSNKEKYTSNAREVDFSDELVDDSNRVEVSLSTDSDRNCVNDICITDVKVLCYENRGIIEYTSESKSNVSSKGFLRLIVGDYDAVIWYDNTEIGKKYKGFHSYEGYDLREIDSNDYKVTQITDDDRTSLSKFTYVDDGFGKRTYTEIGYENESYYDDEIYENADTTE